MAINVYMRRAVPQSDWDFSRGIDRAFAKVYRWRSCLVLVAPCRTTPTYTTTKATAPELELPLWRTMSSPTHPVFPTSMTPTATAS
jgi:hypothetical protein